MKKKLPLKTKRVQKANPKKPVRPTFYITTAIHYSSGLPHIGHAYENILTDVIARCKRLIGFDVYFLTGLDEHGQKIYEVAQKNNYSPKKWTDYIYTKFIELWKKLQISNDGFIRTTDKYHEAAVQKVFSAFLKQKLIYLSKWESLYCVGCEEAYTEEEAIKKPDGLYCRTGHKLITKSEPSYFFKMSKFTQWIKKFLLSQKTFLVPPTRIKELMNTFINKGIDDLSVSRLKSSCKWGIGVADDQKHVVYVWIDALLNYITALGYLQKNDKLFLHYWQKTPGEVVHVVGKDIARFHAIYWPIMLHCLKVREPSHLIAHGWIMAEDGRKMSKSFNNVVDPNALVDKYGSDLVRYYLTKEFLIENDNNFSLKKMQELYNNDLANNYGNLVSRLIGMVNKYTDGKIKYTKGVKLDDQTKILIKTIKQTIKTYTTAVNQFKINVALNTVLELAKAANKYIENTKPWTLFAKKNTGAINNFLFYLTNAARTITVLLTPVLTNGTKQFIDQLCFTASQLTFADLLDFTKIDGHCVAKTSTPIYNRL